MVIGFDCHGEWREQELPTLTEGRPQDSLGAGLGMGVRGGCGGGQEPRTRLSQFLIHSFPHGVISTDTIAVAARSASEIN